MDQAAQDAFVKQLVAEITEHGVIVVRGGRGSGKTYMCQRAAVELGLESYIIDVSGMDQSEWGGYPYMSSPVKMMGGLLNRVPAESLLILGDIQRSSVWNRSLLPSNITKFLLGGTKRKVFITVDSEETEENQEFMLQVLAYITDKIIEVPK